MNLFALPTPIMSSTADLVLAPMFFFIALCYGLLLKNKLTKNYPYLKRYYTPALLVKFLGAILSIWFYDFFLNGSDMTGYYRGSLAVSNAFWNDFSHFLEIFTKNAKDFSNPVYQYFIDMNIAYYMKSEKTMQMCRIGGILSLFTFNSIYAIGAIISLISFIASWRVLQVFCSIYPMAYKGLSYSILFIPSVIFWGTSPLMRDTMVLIFLNFSFTCIFRIFILKKPKFISLIILVVSMYFLITMKIYVALSFVPSAIIWVMFYNKNRRSKRISVNKVFKIIIGLSLALIVLIIISNISQRFRIENILKYATSVQKYHTSINDQTNGSGYNLGDYNSSTLKFIAVIPKSINVVLFRPYITEVTKLALLPSAIEALFSFFLFVIFLFKYKLRFLKLVRTESSVLFCMIFSLTFFFAIGFSTYNFGSLVRYKIQALPFFFSGLSIMYYYLKKKKTYAQL